MRLIDAEEIEELFYKQVEYGATDLVAAFDDALQDARTVDAAELLRDQWISVEDRLPEEDEKCIFFASGNNAAHIGQYVYTGRDGAVKFKKRDGRGTVLYTASHWMPLPDPPEEGKP